MPMKLKKQNDLVLRLKRIRAAADLAIRFAETAHIRVTPAVEQEARDLLAEHLSTVHHEANEVYEKWDEGEYDK